MGLCDPQSQQGPFSVLHFALSGIKLDVEKDFVLHPKQYEGHGVDVDDLLVELDVSYQIPMVLVFDT